ncbi:DNA topoisomerase IV subunit A, partial [Ochrobactrum sp. MR34]|nr:DNA topoisomerase IV subunit A [Ochrobactrum sp. MR34]
RPTYNEEDLEPVVLPGAFPNLLANGSSGIAVGMATNIPPHNVAELCDAALLLIRNPQATVEELVQLVPGPDLPTGGILV